MFNFFCHYTYEQKPTANWIPILAVLVSIFSILCTLYYIYLTKRIEIVNAKFQKFCILSLDEMFKSMDSQLNGNVEIDTFKKQATDLLLEVQLYISLLKKIYPKINLKDIITNIELYTDSLYSNDNISSAEIKSGYISLKLKIYNSLYDFALKNELSFFSQTAFMDLFSKS